MKTKTTVKALGLLVVAGVTAGVLYTSATASQTVEQESRQAVTQYVEASKSGNVDELMKWTNDTRFKSDAEKRETYELIVKNDPFIRAEIVNISVVDSTHANVTLRGTTKGTGTHDVTLPVVKDKGQWKVQVTGVTVEKNDLK